MGDASHPGRGPTEDCAVGEAGVILHVGGHGYEPQSANARDGCALRGCHAPGRPVRGRPVHSMSARLRGLLTRDALDIRLRRTLPRPVYQTLVSRYHDTRTLVGRGPGHGRVLPDFV